MNKELWIQRALEKGIDGFEIYQSVSASKELTWYNHQMDTFVTSDVTGTSLRAIVDGNVSYLAMEKVDDAAMDSLLDRLKEQAGMITTEEVNALVGPMETERVENTHTFKEPGMNEVNEVMKSLEEKILSYDSRVVQVGHLSWNQSGESREITNSLGLQVYDTQKMQLIAANAVVSENGEVKDNFHIELVPDLAAFDEDKFVKELCDEALFKLGGKPIPSQNCKVIFKREAMTSLFSAFSGLFSGEMIAKGISPLKDKLHEKVFSDKITIIDDPRNTDALSLANYDDEGYPTRKKVIVDHGVFEMMLHSTKSAAKMGMESTGNGFKNGFSSPVGVSAMNMYIEPGSKDLKELEEEMQDGLVITDMMGLHAGIDFVSTSFSLQAAGYWVKNGKKEKPVTLITVASSFMELMNQVVAVGSDLDWKYHAIACPSIYFANCAVSGE
jgi:PmbA protein